MFNFIHLEQEKGWRLDKSVIIIYTNPFFTQQEQGLIISPLKIMENISKVRRLDIKDLIAGIRNNKSH